MKPPEKPQLTQEQKDQLRGMVKQAVREMVRDREDLQNKDLVMKRIWAEMLKAPKWSIVHNENKPEDAPDEGWSMVPKVNRP